MPVGERAQTPQRDGRVHIRDGLPDGPREDCAVTPCARHENHAGRLELCEVQIRETDDLGTSPPSGLEHIHPNDALSTRNGKRPDGPYQEAEERGGRSESQREHQDRQAAGARRALETTPRHFERKAQLERGRGGGSVHGV